jgi:hypothetical protein
MNIVSCKNYEELSQRAAQIVLKEISAKPDLLFCAATGNSPTGMYAEMAKKPEAFHSMRVVKMDEWGIIPLSHPDSCETYLKKHLLGPLGIPADRYMTFDTAADLAESECEKMRQFIAANGPFDICILGLGKMGISPSTNLRIFSNHFFIKQPWHPPPSNTTRHSPKDPNQPMASAWVCVISCNPKRSFSWFREKERKKLGAESKSRKSEPIAQRASYGCIQIPTVWS